MPVSLPAFSSFVSLSLENWGPVHSRAMGALLGLLLGMKFHCASALALIALLPSGRERWRALTWCGFTFVASVALALGELPRMTDWVFRLMFHEGPYGAGEIGLLGIDPLRAAWRERFQMQHARGMQIALVLLPLAFVYRWRRWQTWLLLCSAGLTLLLLLKQPPHSRYFLVFLPFVALGLAEASRRLPKPARAAGAVVFIGLCLVWPQAYLKGAGEVRNLRAEGVVETEKLLATRFADCDYYSDSRWLRPFWFRFGLYWIDYRYAQARGYANEFRRWFPRYHFVNREAPAGVDFSRAIDGACRVAIVDPFSGPGLRASIARASFVKLAEVPALGIEFYGSGGR